MVRWTDGFPALLSGRAEEQTLPFFYKQPGRHNMLNVISIITEFGSAVIRGGAGPSSARRSSLVLLCVSGTSPRCTTAFIERVSGPAPRQNGWFCFLDGTSSGFSSAQVLTPSSPPTLLLLEDWHQLRFYCTSGETRSSDQPDMRDPVTLATSQ